MTSNDVIGDGVAEVSERPRCVAAASHSVDVIMKLHAFGVSTSM